MKSFVAAALFSAASVEALRPRQAPAYGAPVPPAYGTGSPAASVPVYGSPSAAPVYGTPSAAPVYGSHSAAPVYGSPSAAPVYGSSSAAPVYPSASPVAPSYGASGSVSAPVYRSSSRAQGSPAPSYLPPSYTTEVVTAITTYCPQPTQVTYGGKTYTVTSATTLTITDCPCTVSKPVPTYTAPPQYVTLTTEVPCPVTSTSSGQTTVYTTKTQTVITGYTTVVTLTRPHSSGGPPASQAITTFLPKPTGTCPAGQMAVPAPITQIADGQPQSPGSVVCVPQPVAPSVAPSPSAPASQPPAPVYSQPKPSTPAPSVAVPQVSSPVAANSTRPSTPRYTGAAAAIQPAIGAVVGFAGLLALL